MVGGLLTPEDDHSLLISQFCENLEYDDIRYHTMKVATSIMARATSQQPEVNSWVSSPPCGDEHLREAGWWQQPGQLLRLGFLQVPLAFWNNAFTLLSAVNLPLQERELTNFYVKHAREFWAW